MQENTSTIAHLGLSPYLPKKINKEGMQKRNDKENKNQSAIS